MNPKGIPIQENDKEKFTFNRFREKLLKIVYQNHPTASLQELKTLYPDIEEKELEMQYNIKAKFSTEAAYRKYFKKQHEEQHSKFKKFLNSQPDIEIPEE